jgi:bifunctional polynucleotide phosphatase/kinase
MDNITTKKFKWKNNEEYLLGKTENFKLLNKVACFDLDGTLIKVKSGKKFPINSNDWLLLYNKITKKINKLIKDEYCFIIVSNQYKLNGMRETEWIKKLDNILNTLNVETLVCCAKQKNKFRKPMTGFFDEIIEKIDNKIVISKKDSFYCGDACGRETDHSDCDYKFAKNIGISFFTPEELFLKEQVIIPDISYSLINNLNHEDYDKINFVPVKNDLIIMVGLPASGKSWFSQKISTKYNYVIINQDILKTKKKCLKEMECNVKKNLNIIIDNTNPSKETRKEYIDIGIKYNYNIRIIHIDSTYELAMHRNYYRMITKGHLIPEIVYNVYRKNFEKPTIDEKVNEILIFKPEIINDQYYYKYLF